MFTKRKLLKCSLICFVTGTSIDQGIAYSLMLVALVLTYLIHPLDSYNFFWVCVLIYLSISIGGWEGISYLLWISLHLLWKFWFLCSSHWILFWLCISSTVDLFSLLLWLMPCDLRLSRFHTFLMGCKVQTSSVSSGFLGRRGFYRFLLVYCW